MTAQSPIRFIDLARQYNQLKPQVDAAIARVLDHGQYIMGPEIGQLEARLSDYVGVEHCIGVASGTEALLIALMALDIGPGDEVITTPFTFVATAEVIALLGATPVLVDIDASCNIDPALIEAAVTDRTRAIMPVALYGQCADMSAINEIAASHGNIPVIEDAAQSFGATFSGAKSCSVSTIGCTSFFPSKPLGCYGDGGAVLVKDQALWNVMDSYRVHGKAVAGDNVDTAGHDPKYLNTRIGMNSRLDTIQAAILLEKLSIFAEEIELREAVARRYAQGLAGSKAVAPGVIDGGQSVWAQYVIEHPDRDGLAAHLKSEGVPTAVYYPAPMHGQPPYAQFERGPGGLPVTEAAAARVLALPMHPYLTPADQDRIVAAIRSY